MAYVASVAVSGVYFSPYYFRLFGYVERVAWHVRYVRACDNRTIGRHFDKCGVSARIAANFRVEAAFQGGARLRMVVNFNSSSQRFHFYVYLDCFSDRIVS